MLDLWTFAAETLPNDGSLLPKHVGVGIWYEMRFAIYSTAMQLVNSIGFF